MSHEQRVEYRVVSPYTREESLEETLNDFAEEGWQLIDMGRDRNSGAVVELVFERQLHETE
ncbi:MAG: hypothetical protein ABEI99_01125 [Halobaculum sp.]